MYYDKMFNMFPWMYCDFSDDLDLNDHRVCVRAGDLQKAI